MCDIYPSNKKRLKTADELRYLLFCQKKQRNELLPPTSDSLRLHIDRTNSTTYIWRGALNRMQRLPSPEGHGWKIQDGNLTPTLMTKEPAPVGLPELTTCSCKRSERRQIFPMQTLVLQAQKHLCAWQINHVATRMVY